MSYLTVHKAIQVRARKMCSIENTIEVIVLLLSSSVLYVQRAGVNQNINGDCHIVTDVIEVMGS